MISPRNTVDKLAKPHLQDITYISHDDIIELFNDTARALEQVRMSASGNTEETLKTNALKVYKEKLVDMQNIKNRLLQNKLKDLPVQGN
ncbi:MAG TPA: hypothetical protein IGS17_12915 [Oscillatoriales cyanobacterium M59_W2019_021]|nr:hypothetical protein [Oscillatoriales cyanobacterium M4454_W2019_049]HIK51805.1 hypothetical protein [Oscillatoriales cyanobacterium M59_W2019_021]